MRTTSINIIRKEIHNDDNVCEVLFDINANGSKVVDLNLSEIKHIRNSILTFVQEVSKKGGQK